MDPGEGGVVYPGESTTYHPSVQVLPDPTVSEVPKERAVSAAVVVRQGSRRGPWTSATTATTPRGSSSRYGGTTS